MSKMLDGLTDTYKEWCRLEGLPYVSADEQDSERLNVFQREWIGCFMRLWDATTRLTLHKPDPLPEHYGLD
jgi:hypothetical protein